MTIVCMLIKSCLYMGNREENGEIKQDENSGGLMNGGWVGASRYLYLD